MFFFSVVAYNGKIKCIKKFLIPSFLFPKKARNSMLNLSYNQKAILNLYERFYHERYPSGSDDEKVTTQTHINSQKMCYLLKMYGINVGDFCFTWNFHGPFSPGLLAVLRSLDQQKENIKAFYSQSNDSDNTALFSEDDKKIEMLINLLNLQGHLDNLPNWMELLGSLAYLSNSVFPYEDYIFIVDELKKRKDKFISESENSDAWQTLKNANLLKILPSNS